MRLWLTNDVTVELEVSIEDCLRIAAHIQILLSS